MRKLTVSTEVFTSMLLGIIESGVTFKAREVEDDHCNKSIEITFDGGY